ncbi:hypothetical protein JZM24_00165 [Candidatus Sodalis endolongispinus]|uniref:Uncharacterized protein n=1 Tax=Candidatus Sodalis endolongispinus TaxID=2812662 RepID=A0ABS5Y7Q4_9GAMM|nr:hypothetical protein [Candidatus Sodalis endolongispinus]MBT9430983.1 hypothetical protein [Candidatus Sodalis endolongispinus]
MQYCGKESSGSHVFNIVKKSSNERLGYNIFIIKNDNTYKENDIVKLERIKDELYLTPCPSDKRRIPITGVAFVNIIVAVMAQYVGIQTAMLLGSNLSLGQLYCCKNILKLVTMRNSNGNINKEKTLACTLKLMGMSNSEISAFVEEEIDFCEEPDSLFNKKEVSDDESSISSDDVARMTFSHLTPIHESQEELVNAVFGENTEYDCFSLQEINKAKDTSAIPLYILETR